MRDIFTYPNNSDNYYVDPDYSGKQSIEYTTSTLPHTTPVIIKTKGDTDFSNSNWKLFAGFGATEFRADRGRNEPRVLYRDPPSYFGSNNNMVGAVVVWIDSANQPTGSATFEIASGFKRRGAQIRRDGYINNNSSYSTQDTTLDQFLERVGEFYKVPHYTDQFGNISIHTIQNEPILIATTELISSDIDTVGPDNETTVDIEFDGDHGFYEGQLMTLSGFDGTMADLNGDDFYVKKIDADTIQLSTESALTNLVEFREQEQADVTTHTTTSGVAVEFTASGHTLQTGTNVKVTEFSGTLAELNNSTNLYAKRVDANTFKLTRDAAGTEEVSYSPSADDVDIQEYISDQDGFKIKVTNTPAFTSYARIDFDDVTPAQATGTYKSLSNVEKIAKAVNPVPGTPTERHLRFGYKTELSNDGRTMVSTDPYYNETGGTDYNGGVWIMKPGNDGGSDAAGWVTDQLLQNSSGDETNYTYYGWDIALSKDGNTLAVYVPGYEYQIGDDYYEGIVEIWERSGGSWSKTKTIQQYQTYFNGAQTLTYNSFSNEMGSAEHGIKQLAINEDGTVIAFKDGATSSGLWFIKKLNGTWEDGFNASGVSQSNVEMNAIAISGDGEKVFEVGRHGNSDINDRGYVVHDISGSRGSNGYTTTKTYVTKTDNTDTNNHTITYTHSSYYRVEPDSVTTNFDGSTIALGISEFQLVEIWSDDSGWSRDTILYSDDSYPADAKFSRSVCGNRDMSIVAVGAPNYGGVDTAGQGDVYLFGNNAGTWSKKEKFTNGVAGSKAFGNAVALDTYGVYLSVGAPVWKDAENKGYVFTRSNVPLYAQDYLNSLGRQYLKETATANVYELYTDLNLTTKTPRLGFYGTVSGDSYEADIGVDLTLSPTGKVYENITPAHPAQFLVNVGSLTDSTTGTLTIEANQSDRYRVDAAYYVYGGNKKYLQQTGAETEVNNARIKDEEYYVPGSATAGATAGHWPDFTLGTFGGNPPYKGYLNGTFYYDTEFPGAFPQDDDIYLIAETVPDTYTASAISTSGQEDTFDTADEFGDTGFNSGLKEWPDLYESYYKGPSSISFTNEFYNSSTESQNGTVFTRAGGMHKQFLEVTYPPLSEAQFKHMHRFAQAVQGSYNPFYFTVHGKNNFRFLPGAVDKPYNSEFRLAHPVAAGNHYVTFTGFDSNQTDALQAGEPIGYSDRKHDGNIKYVLNSADANVFGEARARLNVPSGQKSALQRSYQDPFHIIVVLDNDSFEYDRGTDGFYRVRVVFRAAQYIGD